MSDFLTNLAARTICPATLGPRTRLRFEPLDPTEAVQTATEVSADLAPADLAAPDRSPVPAPRPAPRVVEGLTSLPPVGEVRPPASVGGRIEVSLPSAPGLGPPPRLESRLANPTPADQPPIPAEGQPALAAPRPVAPSIQMPAIEQAAAVTVDPEARNQAPSAERLPAPAPALPKPDRPHRYDLPAPRVHRREERLPGAATPRPPRALARDRLVIRRGAEAGAAEAATEGGEPVVQVSIGRIEVRAVAPAAPPAPPRRSGAMTIEEYTAKRLGQR